MFSIIIAGANMKKLKGFSLIEMLLVLVIIGTFIYMGTNYVQQRTTQARIDKTVMDMQQILNAAMSYYVANGSWPQSDAITGGMAVDNTSLTSTDPFYQFREAYLPKASVGSMPSPWAPVTPTQQALYYVLAGDGGLFYVYTRINTASIATSNAYAGVIAGRLPQGYVSGQGVSPTGITVPPAPASCTNKTCYVVAAVNIPGQNLNNATAVNFVGLYHHGGCIPKPKCPVDANGNTMTPQVFVVPVSIKGVNNNTTGMENTVYPISSFTAYATDAPTTNPKAPALCTGQTSIEGQAGATCNENSVAYNGARADGYWRACVQVITEKGDVSKTRTDTDPIFYWGYAQTVAAYTRCAIKGEAAGSNFQIYGN